MPKRLFALHHSLSALVILTTSLSGQVLFNADFETTTGDNAFGTGTSQWRVDPSGTDTATTGVWQRGNPDGTNYQKDITPSGSFALVTGASATSDGNNDVDGGPTTILSPEIVLPAVAVELDLTFESYFSYSGGAGDYFRVTVQGSTNSAVINIDSGASRDLNSYEETTFDLLPYLGQTITILIEVADSAGGTFVEAGLDDIKIEATQPSISGRVRFDSDADGDIANTLTDDRGLAGAELLLFEADGSGDPTGPALQTVISDSEGRFRFATPANDDYVIVSSPLPGTVSTADSDGANDDRILVAFTGVNSTGHTFLDASTEPGLDAATAIYYLPYEEVDILTALDSLNADAADPVTSVNSISVAYPGTFILYDHWEDNGSDGYEAFPNSPTQRYTEVWGDGNIANGVAPGFADDLLDAGDIIILQNTFDTALAGSKAFYDGRDKLSISKYVAITKASWADSSATLLAGAWELYPTILWGKTFTLPIGADMTDAEDAQMFEFTGASVMAAQDDTQVRLNGVLVAVLSEGETFSWNGNLNLGDRITTSRDAQVQLITGDIGANYESRFFTMQPDTNLSNAYVAPTSSPDGKATVVFIHNANAVTITVNTEVRGLPDQALAIPPGTTISYEIPNMKSARFNSLGGQTFFALAAVDGDNPAAGNQTHDWGYSLVPEAFLSPLAVAGFAPGDDPTFVGTPENSAPLWLAAVFPRGSENFDKNHDEFPENDVQVTLCIDYNGNGNVDGLSTGGTDPTTGLGYDTQMTLDHNDQVILYVDLDEDGIPDPDAAQTGTRVWVCDGSDALLAMAYGQDPNTAAVGTPAVDLGTTIPGIPVIEVAKGVEIENDLNGNTFPDAGDTLRYTIKVANSGTAPFGANFIKIADELNSFIEYVPGTTELIRVSGTTPIADGTTGTVFPIDSNGNKYIFPPTLPPAEIFFITFLADVISVPANGAGSLRNSVQVTAGTNETAVESAAEVPIVTGEISGTVFEDTDADGLGDTPLDNVELILLYGDGSPVDFDDSTPGVQPYTVTTLGGIYRFPNLPVGDYIVQQSQPAGYVTVSDGDSTDTADGDAANVSTVDNLIPVSIVADEIDDGNFFVERLSDVVTRGSVSGSVLIDNDNNGTGDAPLAGVELTLQNSDGSIIDSDPGTPGDQPTTTVTGFDGSYSFSNLLPGDYRIVQTQPTGLVSVSDTDGANDNIIGVDSPLSVVAGSDSGNHDFIEEYAGSLSGIVSADTNGDNTGDAPLANVELTLKDAFGADIDSSPVAGVQPTTTLTDALGFYLFPNLTPGDYQVAETQPSNYISVIDADGGDPDRVGDVTLIAVAAAADTAGNDFVEREYSVISGFVLADTDNNGTGDLGIVGVTITLKDSLGGDIDSDPSTPGVQPTTTLTDEFGAYAFSGLDPGSYQVVQAQPSDYLSASDTDGANNNTIGDETPIVLATETHSTGNNFIEVAPGFISGSVLADIDNDRMGELGISGVLLTLKDGSGNDIDSDPDPAVFAPTTTLTDGAGNYTFTGLVAGSYRVVEEQPSGFLSVSDIDGVNNNTIGDETPIVVLSGSPSAGNDFVEAAFGVLSGSVRVDTNNDRVGDDGIANVLITLKDGAGNDIDSDPGTAGIQATTTLTDATGGYYFANLPAGNYQVVETQPAGFRQVSDIDGANNDIIGDETPIVVLANAETSGNDFTEAAFGMVSGFVRSDTNADNVGDVPISGVLLTLKDENGDDIDSDPVEPGVQPTTALTFDDGSYYFSGLSAGDYQVVQTQPQGFDSVGDTDGLNNNVIGNETAIVVVATGENTDNDFVEVSLSTKSNTYAEFTTEFATELGTEDALADNPDGDMYPNALEYAFCMNPGAGLPDAGEFCLMKESDGSVSAQFMRRRGGLSDVTYTLEGADTLGEPTDWDSLLFTTVVINTTDPDVSSEAEKVTYQNLQNAFALSSGLNGVVRLRVEIDEDASGDIGPGETFFSKIYGWQCNDYNDYQCATYSNPFKRKPVFSGTFADLGTLSTSVDVDGNVTLDVSDSAFGADLAPVVGTNGEFYLQLTSGPLEGERFDILSGGIDELTLLNDPDIFDELNVDSLNTRDGIPADALLLDSSYQVIRHTTVGEHFDETTIYSGEEDTEPGDATRLLFYNSRSTTPGFEILMLIGTNPADAKWVFSSDLFLQTDQADLRLDPSRGNWIHPKNSGNSASPTTPAPVRQFSFGIVADYDQACPINEGFNLLGAMWPLDQTIADVNGRDFSVAAGFDGGIDPDSATELLFWTGDSVVDDASVATYSEGYDNFMLLDGGGMQNWIDINDFFLTDSDDILLESHRSIFLKLLPGDEKKPHLYPLPLY